MRKFSQSESTRKRDLSGITLVSEKGGTGAGADYRPKKKRHGGSANEGVERGELPHDCLTTWDTMGVHDPLKRHAREFIRSTTTRLDHVPTTLTLREQHDLLDASAREVEQRLDA